MCRYPSRQGITLVLTLIVLVVCATMAVSLASFSATNMQLAHNHREANRALANAQSGLEVMRYWLDQATVSGTADPNLLIQGVASSLQTALSSNSVTNVKVTSSGSTLTVPSVTLGSGTLDRFTALVQSSAGGALSLEVYGYHDQVVRRIKGDYQIVAGGNPQIFDYGIASRGPLQIPGNPIIRSANELSEADIYIESSNSLLALDVAGNTLFAGDISVGNPNASVSFDGHVQIAGETGQTAIDNHVTIGAEQVECPVPDTEYFRQYATGQVISSSTDTSSNMTLTNARIAAGVNPSFDGNIIVDGVLFIETPNEVLFNGNVWVNGLIVANGDVNNPGTNELEFAGNYDSGDFPSSSTFDNMRAEMGSSLLAPGFNFHLRGNLRSLGGAMAVSGLFIEGNIQNAVIKGTMINYDTSTGLINGNIDLTFDRSSVPASIAGFTGSVPSTLKFVASSYSEPTL